LHYDNGTKTYAMQQTIPPGEQMWVNLAELIHNRAPDRKGNVVPADVSSGTYDLQDLGHGPGSLLMASLAPDSVWGNPRQPPQPECCGTTAAFDLSSSDITIGGLGASINARGWDICANQGFDLFSYVSSWYSGNAAIATVTPGKVKGVAPGFTFADGETELFYEGYGSNCHLVHLYPTAPVTVLVATISIQSSGTIPTANSARGEYHSVTGSYNLGNFVDSGGYCTIGYQATGALNPSSYTGTVTLVRTKQGMDYDGTTGQTVLNNYGPGTPDTSDPAFEVRSPTNGVVYDLDAPGVLPTQNQIWRKRMNFFENAQLPDGTYIANEVGFYTRFSCKWASGGNTFGTDVGGDNVLGMGSTKTSWNLQ
jgi:hypothetical protein